MNVRRSCLALASIAVLLAVWLLPAGEPAAEAQGSFDQQLIARVNEFRVNNGLPALATSPSLSSASLTWSQSMSAPATSFCNSGGFFHDPALPPGDFENIAFACGVAGTNTLPNPPFSNATAGPLPAFCFQPMDQTGVDILACGWFASPGHRANILNAAHTQIGSGSTTRTFPSGFGTTTSVWATHRFNSDAVAGTPTPTTDPAVTPTPTADPTSTPTPDPAATPTPTPDPASTPTPAPTTGPVATPTPPTQAPPLNIPPPHLLANASRPLEYAGPFEMSGDDLAASSDIASAFAGVDATAGDTSAAPAVPAAPPLADSASTGATSLAATGGDQSLVALAMTLLAMGGAMVIAVRPRKPGSRDNR